MSQYGGRPPLVDDIETKYQSNMDVTTQRSMVEEPAFIKAPKESKRKFRNAKDDISNFFKNLTKTKHKRSKSGDDPRNIPF